MFQSKVFRRLFFTYIMVIFGCLLIYTSFIVYENYRINRIQIERKSEIQLDEVSNILDTKLMNAQNIVQNLSYSTSMKQLYINAKMGMSLDSYALFSIQSEMKNTMASAELSIYKTIVFVDGSSKAYSSGGVIVLGEEFRQQNREFPYMLVDSVNGAFGLNSTKRYSFNQEFLLYCDAYTYQNGTDIGTICIAFNLKNLETNIKSILQDGYGTRILYQGNEIFSMGECEGELYVAESARIQDIVYEVYASDKIPTEGNEVFYLFIAIVIVLSLAFVWLAYWESKKYYMPIDHLEQMVSTDKQKSIDEMEQIIHGIENLIGEKNGYREKMLTITPYAETGMLHSMITGSMEADKLGIFSEENYLDLIKPYFIVSSVNFMFDGKPKLSEEEWKQFLSQLFRVITDTFSTDETRIVYYFKDNNNVFLITNFENEDNMDELFYQIHRYISTSLENQHCLVTMGVDILRDDIGELKQACEGAVEALNGILTTGRGEVYFLEDKIGKTTTYYFPVNFREKLKRCLVKQEKDEIHILLFDVYKKNLDLEGTKEMYRALLDEFHLAVIKTIREITELNTVHLNIEKYTGLATLQEIFDYYDAALLSVIDALAKQEEQAAEDSRLEDDIISYLEAHYCDADLSLQSLTDRFNVSNKFLTILCKNRFEMTYLQYIQTKRIQKAAELLKEKRYTLAEIGDICGYTNPLTFRRNFKSIMGVNPSDYAENQDFDEK